MPTRGSLVTIFAVHISEWFVHQPGGSPYRGLPHAELPTAGDGKSPTAIPITTPSARHMSPTSPWGLGAGAEEGVAAGARGAGATLYRLFPGKPALFTSLLRTYSPLEPVSRLANRMQDEPPEVVMPEIARTVFRTISGSGAPGIGLLRAIVFEVSSLSPDAEEAARDLIATILGSVGAYVMAQMAAGRLRMMHPLPALQAFIGPIFFHLLTRSLVERVAR